MLQKIHFKVHRILHKLCHRALVVVGGDCGGVLEDGAAAATVAADDSFISSRFTCLSLFFQLH